jgi:hypothetical protein
MEKHDTDFMKSSPSHSHSHVHSSSSSSLLAGGLSPLNIDHGRDRDRSERESLLPTSHVSPRAALSSSGINTYDRSVRFWFYVGGIMFFFGLHNYMQELIMSLPGFKIGVLLGYLEVLGVTICSYAERHISGETARKSPWSVYIVIALCLLVSSAASNIALGYINYPTKVVFRSCKVCYGLGDRVCIWLKLIITS